MKRWKAIWMLMSAIALVALGVGETRAQIPPPAATVVITDNGAPHAPLSHVRPFTTTLTASVRNPPRSTTEATISGPQWIWSGGTSAVSLTSNADSPTNGLTTPLNPYYGNHRGLYTIPVQCTARYTRTDSATGAQSYINAPGTTDVTVFLRWPASIHLLRHYPAVHPRFPEYGLSPWNGPLAWGHADGFDMQIRDNQATPRPYEEGQAHEEFTNVVPVGALPNGSGGGGTWPAGANITDYTVTLVNREEDLPPDHLEMEYDQIWSCIEPLDTTILGTHHVWNYYKYAERLGR